MSASGNEFSGKTVEDALEEALRQLGLRRDQVNVEVLNKGSRGIFGLGGESARVRVIPRPAVAAAPAMTTQEATHPVVAEVATPPSTAPAMQGAPVLIVRGDEELVSEPSEEPEADEGEAAGDEAVAAIAVELLQRMVSLMGFETSVIARWHEANEQEDEPYLLLNVEGEDLGVLIGRRGETLANIQFLLRLIVNHRLKRWVNVVVDVEQYKERRIVQLTQLALRMADQVVQSGRSISLEPMPAGERRVVHLALRDHPSVYTESSGEGERRKVHILAKH